MNDEAGLAECTKVCTSGCHADDCEHHGHLPAERQAGLREALERHVDATATSRGVQFKLSHSEYHVPAPAVRDWLRAALASQVPTRTRLPDMDYERRDAMLNVAFGKALPAQKERLDVERLAAAAQNHETSGIHGPLHCSLACGATIAAEYRALGDETKEEAGCTICGTTEGTTEANRHAWLHP